MLKANITTPYSTLANTDILFKLVFNTNDNTEFENGVVTIVEPGFYEVDVMITYNNSTSEIVNAQLYADGVAIPESLSNVTSGAVTDLATINITDAFRVLPSELRQYAKLSVRVSEPVTIQNAILVVKKVR